MFIHCDQQREFAKTQCRGAERIETITFCLSRVQVREGYNRSSRRFQRCCDVAHHFRPRRPPIPMLALSMAKLEYPLVAR